MTRFACALGCIAAAVVCPLLTLSMHNEAGRPPVITMPGGGPETGVFPAAWTTAVPSLATVVGVFVPMGLLGVATYVLVRRPCAEDEADAAG